MMASLYHNGSSAGEAHGFSVGHWAMAFNYYRIIVEIPFGAHPAPDPEDMAGTTWGLSST
jgi:hypothetical protein